MAKIREAEHSTAPAAIVLAGGRSARMGGGDKSLLTLGGRPLLSHVLDRLIPQADKIAISANGDPSRFAQFGLPVLPDTMEGYLGPLAGLLAGMDWAQATGAAQIASVPTDSPFIPADLTARLMSSASPDRPALAASGGKHHPVVGLWPVALAGRLRDFLESGATYKVSAFAQECGAVLVDFPVIALTGDNVDPFFNVNTPEDLSLAEKVLEETQR
ncbi:molybdenum cofactor guanylyltransferase MobA [Mesorhizobium sp. BAC0120]|uniref:molybdenum cofactor guanylyltransferase MobA n=1 Tax=Mesorhizobium sp. BAC0120 TaxID=3090670 RepID=UPI00298D4DA7|nr:molybdenum cofactor guanylyltransferase MobA [Mesorhizobium sp. BAC0120]MDW6023696.1 molybdenum cofactor guanylyltransferase MobA [Mesorhizobium sp. BAC0120]